MPKTTGFASVVDVIQGSNATALFLTSDSQVFTFNTSDSLAPTSQTITFTANPQNVGTSTVSFSTSPSVTLSGSGNTRTLTGANFGTNNTVAVTASVTVNSVTFTDTVTVHRLSEGALGESTYTVFSTNESHTVQTGNDGTGGVFTGSATTVSAFYGTKAMTFSTTTPTPVDSFRVVSVTNSGVTGPTTTASATIGALTAMAGDNGTRTILVNIQGPTGTTAQNFSVVQSFSKSKEGLLGDNQRTYTLYQDNDPSTPVTPANDEITVASTGAATLKSGSGWSLTPVSATPPFVVYASVNTFTQTNGAGTYARDAAWSTPAQFSGSSAPVITLRGDNQAFSFSDSATPDPTSQTITFTATRTNIASGSATTFTTSPSVTLGGSGDTTRTLTVANFGTTNTSVTITATAGGVSDSFTVQKLVQGNVGADGESGYTVLQTNETHNIPAATDGFVSTGSGSFSGSSTTITAFQGTSGLTFVNNADPGTNQFNVNVANGSGVDGPSGLQSTSTVGEITDLENDTGIRTITVEAEGATGSTEQPIVITQSFAKSRAGLIGDNTRNISVYQNAGTAPTVLPGDAANDDGVAITAAGIVSIDADSAWNLTPSTPPDNQFTFVSRRVFRQTNGVNAYVGEGSWTASAQFSGDTGAKGDDSTVAGPRGPVIGFYAGLTDAQWNSGSPTQANLDAAFNTKTGNTAPVTNDYGTFFQTSDPTQKITRAYGTSDWASAAQEIDGSLFVTGTVAAASLIANSITAGQIATDAIEAGAIKADAVKGQTVSGGAKTSASDTTNAGFYFDGSSGNWIAGAGSGGDNIQWDGANLAIAGGGGGGGAAAFASGTTYNTDEQVYHGGNFYVATSDGLTTAPPSTGWEALVGGDHQSTESRLTIGSNKIEIYEGNNLRVVLGDLS